MKKHRRRTKPKEVLFPIDVLIIANHFMLSRACGEF